MRQDFFKATRNSNLLDGSIYLIGLADWLEGRLKTYFNPLAEIVVFQDQENLSNLHYNIKTGKSKFNNSLTFNPLNLDDHSDDEDKSIRTKQLLGNKGEDDNSITKDKTDTEDNSEVVSCWLCTQQHRLMEYDKFKNKPIEEKIKIVKEQRLCWNFLSKGHVLKNCKSQHRCKVSGCNQQHHTLPHREKTPEASTTKLATSEVNQTTYLQLLPVIVSHGKNSVSGVAFLDSRSDSTLISKSLADSLQLLGKEHNLVLSNVMSMSIKLDLSWYHFRFHLLHT